MPIFDKKTIINFANNVEEDVVDKTMSILSLVMEKSINDLSKRNPLINANIEILPVNEFYTNSILPNSKLDVLLVVSSPQLEYNTVKLIKNKFKTFWIKLKYAWINRNKKKKKKQKYINKLEELNVTPKVYTMYNFEVDLINHISTNIPTSMVVALKNGVVEISGEDIPFACKIYPVIDKTGSYNFYLPKKNKFINIDFQDRFKNLETLVINYGDSFSKLIKMFTAIYYNIMEEFPNALFIESLIANLPKETFNIKDLYEQFIFAVNYLINKQGNEFFAITDVNKKLINEELCDTSLVTLSNFMKNLQKYL